MAILTKDQWYTKLVSWVPQGFFEDERLNKAHFMALAAILYESQFETEQHFDETFIDRADGEFLDEHGADREKPRFTDEDDFGYSTRLKQFFNQSNRVAIKAAVEAQLRILPAIIVEDYQYLYFDRECFPNRDYIYVDSSNYNEFTVVIPLQGTEPLSFESREYFFDREHCFSNSGQLLSDTFQNILFSTINQIRAAGVRVNLRELSY